MAELELEQFLNYVLDSKLSSRHYNDRHIIPYTQSCGICHFKYDYILRLETLEDARPMLKLLNYTEDFLTNPFIINSRHRETETMGVHFIQEFRDLPKILLEKLAERYQNDMKMFGYHFDMHTSQTWCALQKEDGSQCC